MVLFSKGGIQNLFRLPYHPFVFVIQADSSAATRTVTVARTAGDLAVVSGEIRPGDRVVTDGQLRLRQGAKVQIK